MGDQDIFRSFDVLPLPLELPSYMESPANPAEVIAGLVQTASCPNDYPHFPCAPYPEGVDEARCTALREFLYTEIQKCLCTASGLKSLGSTLPAALIVSAIIDILNNLSERDYLPIMRRSAIVEDPTGSSFPEDRFERSILLILKTSRTLDFKEHMGEWVILPAGNEQVQMAEKLINVGLLPKKKLTPSGLWYVEFSHWIQHQLSQIQEVLEPTGLWNKPYIENGKLIRNRLPNSIIRLITRQKKLSTKQEKQNTFHDAVVQHFEAKLGDKPRQIKTYMNSSGKKGKSPYDLLLKQYFPSEKDRHQYAPTDRTVRRWLGAGERRKWKAKRGLATAIPRRSPRN